MHIKDPEMLDSWFHTPKLAEVGDDVIGPEKETKLEEKIIHS